MKKYIILIGVLTVILCVFLSGCQIYPCPDPSENKPVLIGCIFGNPDVYLNKTVIIKGWYNDKFNRTQVETVSIYYANVPDSLDIIISDQVNTSQLMPGNEYYFIGIVKIFEDYTYNLGSGPGPYYLECHDIGS